MSTITEIEPGKFRVTWPIETIRTQDGHYVTARPTTARALTKGKGTTVAKGEAFKIGTLTECQAQEG